MTLCAPVRHAVSWQKAVKAVSGEDILEDVMSEWTGVFMEGSSRVEVEEEEEIGSIVNGVSALMGADGW